MCRFNSLAVKGSTCFPLASPASRKPWTSTDCICGLSTRTTSSAIPASQKVLFHVTALATWTFHGVSFLKSNKFSKGLTASRTDEVNSRHLTATSMQRANYDTFTHPRFHCLYACILNVFLVNLRINKPNTLDVYRFIPFANRLIQSPSNAWSTSTCL